MEEESILLRKFNEEFLKLKESYCTLEESVLIKFLFYFIDL